MRERVVTGDRTPRTVPIVCGKSRQRRGASIAVRRSDGTWYCASCGRRVRVTAW